MLGSDICTYFHGEHAYRSGPKQGFNRASYLIASMLNEFLVGTVWPVVGYSEVQTLLITITAVCNC